jgi:hypothetical protein
MRPSAAIAKGFSGSSVRWRRKRILLAAPKEVAGICEC